MLPRIHGTVLQRNSVRASMHPKRRNELLDRVSTRDDRSKCEEHGHHPFVMRNRKVQDTVREIAMMHVPMPRMFGCHNQTHLRGRLTYARYRIGMFQQEHRLPGRLVWQSDAAGDERNDGANHGYASRWGDHKNTVEDMPDRLWDDDGQVLQRRNRHLSKLSPDEVRRGVCRRSRSGIQEWELPRRLRRLLQLR